MRFLKFAPASALLAVVLTVLFGWKPFGAPEDVVWLEVPMESSAPGVASLGIWSGPGHWHVTFPMAHVRAHDPNQVLRFRVPGGRTRRLMFAPLQVPSTVALGPAVVRDSDGNQIIELGISAWKTADGAPLQPLSGGRVGFVVGSSAHQWPITLAAGMACNFSSGREVAPIFLASMFLALTSVFVFIAARFESGFSRFWAGVIERGRRFFNWGAASPGPALALVAVLSTVCACFPTIFCGKSFVSPNNDSSALYEGFPTIPGITSLSMENGRMSDTLATQLGHRPWTKYAYESLVEHGEFPLWDRYNSCGTPFLGNGLNMLGDPLHWPVILSNSASWAWDAKFVIARWLFAWGIGLCVWKATGHFGVAVLVGFGANFLGFFGFRLCHPAAFSMCYAPWILFAWLNIASARTRRSMAGWALLLLLACNMEFHSGTAKEAAMLIAFLNASGLLAVCFAEWRKCGERVAFGLCACIAFVLINAPFWLVFVDSLKEAYSVYTAPPIVQVQPAAFVGLFDDTFYQRLVPRETLTNPAANFLIFSGFLLALLNIRHTWRSPVGKAIILSSLPALAFAFGGIPASVIRKIPFIANISHVGNTFSCVLIVQFAILSGIGFSAWLKSSDKANVRRRMCIYLGLLACIAGVYFFGANGVSTTGEPVDKLPDASPFFVTYVTLILVAAAVLPIALLAFRRASFCAVVAMAVLVVVPLFRHAQYVETSFDYYAINLQERNEFQATSPAVESLRPLLAVPARVAGIRGVLMPGYNGPLRLDNVCSADTLTCRFLHELLDQTALEKVWGWRTVFQAQTLAETQKISDFLNVKYFLAPLGSGLPPGFRALSTSDLVVWESPTAWPRAFFTDQLASYEKPAELVKMIAASDGRPFAAVQRADAQTAPKPERQTLAASRVTYTTNAATVALDAPSAGVVVLGESWFEGDMLASINGQPANPLRVNHAFRGVELPAAGHYVVEFRYRPRRLTLALWLSGAGALLAVVMALRSLLIPAVVSPPRDGF